MSGTGTPSRTPPRKSTPPKAAMSAEMAQHVDEIVTKKPPSPKTTDQSHNRDHFIAPANMHLKSQGTKSFHMLHEGKDTEDHFTSPGSMGLADSADAGNAFDAAYGTEHEGKDTASHFISSTMDLTDDPTSTCANKLDPMRPDLKNYTYEEAKPPPRAKFMRKPLSVEMQAHVDGIVTSKKSTDVLGRDRRVELGASVQKFAWGPERIGHELVQKMEQITRRREDHMRTLLWAVGTDPYFDTLGEADKAGSQIRVTPKNFDRICDRFGLHCTEEQAASIFKLHGLPESGANVYDVACKFLDTQKDTAQLVRSHQRKVLGATQKQEASGTLAELVHLAHRGLTKLQAVGMADFEVGKTIGVGSFGQVRLAVHTETGAAYALKTMYKGMLVATQQVRHVQNEKRVLIKCAHPFLLGLAGTFQDEHAVHMVLEFVQGGELFSVLRDARRLEEPAAAFYAATLVCALEYLHDRKIVYRDLKPENVLLDEQGYLKLVDFGFAKEVANRTWTLCGTPEYLAPEVVLGEGHSTHSDWWALGIMVWEMLHGNPPFAAPQDAGASHVALYRQILVGRLPTQEVEVASELAMELITRLLAREPRQRLGCSHLGASAVKQQMFFAFATLTARADWQRLERKLVPAPYIPKISGPLDTSHCGTDWDVNDLQVMTKAILEHQHENNETTATLFGDF